MFVLMDALVKPRRGPGLELVRVEVPEPGWGEVLIRIRKTAICGTDVHIYNWDPWAEKNISPPLIEMCIRDRGRASRQHGAAAPQTRHHGGHTRRP